MQASNKGERRNVFANRSNTRRSNRAHLLGRQRTQLILGQRCKLSGLQTLHLSRYERSNLLGLKQNNRIYAKRRNVLKRSDIRANSNCVVRRNRRNLGTRQHLELLGDQRFELLANQTPDLSRLESPDLPCCQQRHSVTTQTRNFGQRADVQAQRAHVLWSNCTNLLGAEHRQLRGCERYKLSIDQRRNLTGSNCTHRVRRQRHDERRLETLDTRKRRDVIPDRLRRERPQVSHLRLIKPAPLTRLERGVLLLRQDRNLPDPKLTRQSFRDIRSRKRDDLSRGQGTK